MRPPSGGEFHGCFYMPGWSYEDFFFTEFMPANEKKYRAIGDSAHRAIAGLSMGDGGHTWEYWHSALYTALPFVCRTFNENH